MRDPRKEIRASAKRISNHKQAASREEKRLQKLIANLIVANRGGLRDWARQMGISAQYACDIRHGRRKISDSIIEKIMKGGVRLAR